MDAKCPMCNRRAQVDDDVTSVRCLHCGYEEGYDAYIARMKERVSGIVSDFHEPVDDN